MKLNTTENLSEGDRRAIVEHFAKEHLFQSRLHFTKTNKGNGK